MEIRLWPLFDNTDTQTHRHTHFVIWDGSQTHASAPKWEEPNGQKSWGTRGGETAAPRWNRAKGVGRAFLE